MIDEFIPYARQSVNASDLLNVSNALSSPIITRGPYVEKFEQAIADYCGASYAVAFNSGSTALLAACHAAQINSFDRLISTPNTFVATIGSAVQYGATPKFVDIDPLTGNIDIKQIEYTLELPYSQGRPIIIPVHFSGIPVDVEAIDNILKDPDAVIIEDACHALGSSYKSGKRVGSCTHSAMTVFSFHPAKTITTGEGGMVTTNDERLYRNLMLYRNNGIERSPDFLEGKPAPWYYEVQQLTNNTNFTDFQAALGLSQLERLDEFIIKRRQLVAHYRKLLEGIPHISLFTDEYDPRTAFHLFVVQIDYAAYSTTRENLMESLRMQGIGTQVHYIPVYSHPYFKRMCGNLSPYFPANENYYAKALSLPLFYDLSFEQVDKIVATLLQTLRSRHKGKGHRHSRYRSKHSKQKS